MGREAALLPGQLTGAGNFRALSSAMDNHRLPAGSQGKNETIPPGDRRRIMCAIVWSEVSCFLVTRAATRPG